MNSFKFISNKIEPTSGFQIGLDHVPPVTPEVIQIHPDSGMESTKTLTRV